MDNIQHPQHYNREGAIEAIDEMVLIFGVEAVKNFCLCNIWKYRYRAADKNGEEDLRKSDWYMNKYKELCELENKNKIPTLTLGEEPINPNQNIWINKEYFNKPYIPITPLETPCSTPKIIKWPPDPQLT